ncbi:unnamed protein product [Orchesella dallaii]|uniref:Uncharacterized protein n=1 Tax=Orchesella dallaii TaxID=48710 RepID=A0ABP1RAT8_9HEXA
MFIRKTHGIAINSKTEQIYVADRLYDVVLVLGPDGSYHSQIGGPGSTPGKFFRPTALAFDAATDRLYVTDKDNHRVQVFHAPSGQFLFTFGSQGTRPGTFGFPWGIAILNKEGGSVVAVADSRNQRVQFFTKEGLYLDHFDDFPNDEEGRQQQQLWTTGRRNYPIKNQPRGLAFDPTGELLYITDFNHHCIFKLDLARRTLHKVSVSPAATTNTGRATTTTRNNSVLYRPSGIDVDSEGNIILCDQRNNLLRKFRKDGSEVEQFITGVSFKLPSDLSLFPGVVGYVAVMDDKGRLRVLNFTN